MTRKAIVFTSSRAERGFSNRVRRKSENFRKGIVFTLMSVIIALSMFSLLTNYRLFVSELTFAKPQDTGIPQTFAYIGAHVQEIADVDVRVTFNASHTFVNFTDRAPRDVPYNDSLKAYRDFLIDKMNLSYVFDFNASVPANESAFEIGGMNAQYNYSNFTKHNISVVQRNGQAAFVKRYEIFVVPMASGCTANAITTVTEAAGDLSVFISSMTQTLQTSVARNSTSRYLLTFAGGCPGTVNITLGNISSAPNGYNASLRIDPTEKVRINTSIIAKTGELPKT
ncbi:MAG: hypothetical protein HY366_01005 [Candidatus Aenigmarchaeota archaeon]|nr:hypothetical protein [Candidatus Aenigmarchaeota archaeon]